jgi:hypothetical protein
LLKEATVLIGGSFVDLANAEPNDIDIVLLTQNDSPSEVHENFLYNAGMISKGIDLRVLPINYSLTKFKAYSNITHLGNQVSVKRLLMTNNDFKKRLVQKLKT